MEKEVLTAEDLAEYLGFNRNWVYRKAEAGELPGVKLGRSWRFKRSVIDQWLEERIGKQTEIEARTKAAQVGEVKAKAEELPLEAAGLLERVFEEIKKHPQGVTLPEVGQSLGMDWRRLTSFVNRLLREGRARRGNRKYFPVG